MEWVSEERERTGSTKLHKDRRCWRGAAQRRLRHKQPTRVGIRSLARGHCGPCMRPQRLVPVRAQEVRRQNRFEHLADEVAELPIPMTSEESVPLTVESMRSGQYQNKRGSSVYVPRAKPRKSQKERKRALIHCDTPPGLLCPSLACSS